MSVTRLCRQISPFNGVVLLLILPLILFINPERVAVLLVLPVLMGVRFIGRKRPFPTTPLNHTIALLTLMIGVSLYATADWQFSLPKVAGLLYGIALFHAVVDATRPPRAIWWGTAVYVMLTLSMALIGSLGVQFDSMTKIAVLAPLMNRIPSQLLTGEAINANQIGGVLTWIAPLLISFSVYLLRHKHPLGFSLLTYGTTLFTLFLLILTQSRSAWLGVICALGLIIIVALRHSRRALFALALATITIGVLGGIYWQTQTTLLDEQTSLTIATRLEIWARALYGLEDFALTGMGMNMFRRIVQTLYPLFLAPPHMDIAHAHNQWLQVGLDLGVIGLIAYLAIWIGALKMLWKSWHTAPTASGRTLALGFAASLLAHAIYGLFDAIALGAKPSFLLWILFALIVSLHQQKKQRLGD